MKKTILLFFLSILGLVFLSCQHSVDGVYFDEAAFNEAKLKWENDTFENFKANVQVRFGIWNTPNPPTWEASIYAKVDVKNGIYTYEHLALLDDMYNVDPNTSAADEFFERLEKDYGISSALVLTPEDMFRLIEERVTEAKKRYNNSKWLFYKMEVHYNEVHGFPSGFEDYYVYNKFGDKDEIDNIMFRIIPMGLNWD